MRRSHQAKRCREERIPEEDQVAVMIGRSIGRCIHGEVKSEQESKISVEMKYKRSIDEKVER